MLELQNLFASPSFAENNMHYCDLPSNLSQNPRYENQSSDIMEKSVQTDPSERDSYSAMLGRGKRLTVQTGLLLVGLVSALHGQTQTLAGVTGTTTANDYGRETAPDGVGGVFITADTEGNMSGSNFGSGDAVIARYDETGTQLWVDRIGTPGPNSVTGAAPDGAGGVYICGYTGGSLGGPHARTWDAFIAHYEALGNQSWIHQIGTTFEDQATAVAPDGAGGVLVSGWTEGSLAGVNQGDSDIGLHATTALVPSCGSGNSEQRDTILGILSHQMDWEGCSWGGPRREHWPLLLRRIA